MPTRGVCGGRPSVPSGVQGHPPGCVATLGRIRGYSKTFPSFFSTFFTAPPPQYTTCGGYSTGAAGSSVKRLSSRPTVANPVFV